MKKVLAWVEEKVKSLLGSSTGQVAESMLANAGESKLEAILQDLHDSNLDDYKAAIEGAQAFVRHLTPLAAKTDTTIDDMVLSDIQTVITQSATKNGITL